MNNDWNIDFLQNTTALLAGAVEYTDCISAEEKDPTLNKCPGYDI